MKLNKKQKQRETEKEGSSHNWISDETNIFCEILADPVNNFMETSGWWALKKAFSSKVFDSIIAEFKGVLENAQFKEKKSKNFTAKKKKTTLVDEVKTFTWKNL